MIVLAGVDAGGSHTEAAISTRGFRSITRGSAGPGFLGPSRIGLAVTAIETALREALGKSDVARADALTIGAAGAGDPAYREELQTAIAKTQIAELVRVVTDADLALECALPSRPGILLASGTGSIAVGRDSHGTTHRVGGHGHTFGDEGSGYAIGAAGIRAVFHGLEHRGPTTVLQDLLFVETGATSLPAFARWTRIASRQEIADLASVVQLASQSGDACARHIIQRAVEALVSHVRALLPLVSPTGPLALAGGLLGNPTPLRAAFVSHLERNYPAIELVETTIDPVVGALMLARRFLTESASDES